MLFCMSVVAFAGTDSFSVTLNYTGELSGYVSHNKKIGSEKKKVKNSLKKLVESEFAGGGEASVSVSAEVENILPFIFP